MYIIKQVINGGMNMECPLLENTKVLNLITEIQRLEKLLDEVVEERNSYKKFYDDYREEQDKDDWGI